MSVKVYGASVSVVARKLQLPVGCELLIDTANRPTGIWGLLLWMLTVCPPHGSVGSSSSTKPALGGHSRRK